MHAFGAVFTEVCVNRELGEIRVPRIVGAYGIVWGVGLALMEATWRDPRNGRFVNANLGEYHVPVNADIGQIDIVVVPEDDPHVNALGAKGIGEIGITGVGGAIANAVSMRPASACATCRSRWTKSSELRTWGLALDRIDTALLRSGAARRWPAPSSIRCTA